MKRLLLLRHAKAEPAVAPLADISRPLADRGVRDAAHIGGRLQKHYGRPARVVASPAVRAQRTAALVAAAVEYEPSQIATDQRLYLAEPKVIKRVIAEQPPDVASVLIVGHNPGLSELVQELLPSFDVADLPTAAVVGLDYASITEWRELERGAARLAYYDFPKNASAPVRAR